MTGATTAAGGQQTNAGIWAVVVACNRPAELERLLAAIAAQSVAVDRVLVIDNGTNPLVAQVAAARSAQYHRSLRNMGGAGGFALGMLLALAGGARTLWLWDDDGWPEGEDCLERLLGCSADAPGRAAFGYRLNGRTTFSRAALQQRPLLHGMAHLFNGTVVPATTADRFGIPDIRLFIRGDEVDFLYRVLAGGGIVATVTAAVARHPSAEAETHSLLGGRIFAVHPADPMRRAMLFRNRGYLFRRHRRWGFLALDHVRYTLFFIVRRRPDLAGFRAWLRQTWRGVGEKLGPPP